MTDTTVSKLQTYAETEAYSATACLPRPNYDGMHMAHCTLTLMMMEATKDYLALDEWPANAKEEHKNAMRLIDKALIHYEEFLHRYGLIGGDFHEDYIQSAQGQARLARLDEAEKWARTQFLALPDLPEEG